MLLVSMHNKLQN